MDFRAVRNIKLCSLLLISVIFSHCGLMVRNFVGSPIDRSYHFKDKTKRELKTALDCFYNTNPAYKPKNDSDFLFKMKSISDVTNEKTDSARFYFEIVTKDSVKIIYWTTLNKLQEDGDSKSDLSSLSTKLVLYGLWINNDLYYITKNKDKRKNGVEAYIKKFEEEILPKIQKCMK